MLDVSGYGCLAAYTQGERHSASSYKFVNVHFPSCYIPLYLISHDSSGSPECTLLCACVRVSSHFLHFEHHHPYSTSTYSTSGDMFSKWIHFVGPRNFKGLFEG